MKRIALSLLSPLSLLSLVLLLLPSCIEPLRDSPLDPGSPFAANGSITGRVIVDVLGADLGAVRLDEVDVELVGVTTVRADGTGAFAFDAAPPGAYEVCARARFHVEACTTVNVAPAKASDAGVLSLARGRGAITGTLLVAGAQDHGGTSIVVVTQPDDLPRSAVTDPSGAFSIADVIAGFHTLAFSRPFYPSAGLEAIEVPAGDIARVGTTTLGDQAAIISGVVVLEDRAAPDNDYTAVTVTLVGPGASAAAQADGTFQIASTLGGEFALQASRAEYEPAIALGVVVVPGEPTAVNDPLVLRVARGGVRGTVSAPGLIDESGVQVFVLGGTDRASTDATGNFSLLGVPTRPSTVQLGAEKILVGEGFVLPAPLTVTLVAGQVIDVGNLSLVAVGGDFDLIGTIFNPIANIEEPSTRFTREVTVALDLSRVGVADEMRRALDLAALDGEPFEPVPAGAIDCATAISVGCIDLPAVDGEHDVFLELRTSTGEVLGPFRSSIILDRTPPARAPGSEALEVNGGAAFVDANDDDDLTVLASAIDATSAVSAMQLWVDADPNGANPTAPVPFAIENVLALPGGDGARHVHAIFFDAAGNASGVFTSTIVVDRAAPTLNAVAVAGALGEPAGFARSGVVTVAIDGDASADEQLTLILSEDPLLTLALNSAQQADAGGAVVVDETFVLRAGDGPRTIFAALRDAAGNVSAVGEATIVVDTIAPAAPAVALTESDSRPANGFTNDPEVTLALFPSSDTRALDVVGCPATLAFNGAPPARVDVACTLAGAADERKLLSVTATDAAGNVGAAAVASVTLDRAPPASPPISVVSSAGFVASQIVAFTLAPTSPLPEQMRIVDGNTDCASVTEWQPLSFVGQHVLAAGDGVHLVRACFRDEADNIAIAPSEVAVILDTLAPGIPAARLLTPSATNVLTARIDTGAQPAGDVVRFELQGGAACPSFASCVRTSAGVFDVALTAQSTNLLRVRAVDGAGNASTDALFFVTHDAQAPSTPIIREPQDGRITRADVLRVELAAPFPDDGAGGSGIALFEGAVLAPDGDCESASFNALAGADNFAYVLNRNAGSRLCLRVVDRAGNVSGIAQVNVVHDDVPPTRPAFRPAADVVTGDSAIIFVQTPANDVNFHHYEIVGGPLDTFTCLPIGSPTPCPADPGRDVYEIPLLADQLSTFEVRAVDAAELNPNTGLGGNASATFRIDIQEDAIAVVSDEDTAAPARVRIFGDRIVWLREAASGNEARGVHLLDLGAKRPGEGATLVNDGTTGLMFDVSVRDRVVAWAGVQGAQSQAFFCSVDADGVCVAPTQASNGAGTVQLELGAPTLAMRTSDHSIRTIDVGTLATATLASGTTTIAMSVDANLVAWIEEAAGSRSLIARRVGGAATTVRTVAGATMFNAVVRRDRVFWDELSQQTVFVLFAAEPFSSFAAIPDTHDSFTVWDSVDATLVVSLDDTVGDSQLQVVRTDDRAFSLGVPGRVADRQPWVSLDRAAFINVDANAVSAVHVAELASRQPFEAAGDQLMPALVDDGIAWIDRADGGAGDVIFIDRGAGLVRVVSDAGDAGAGSRDLLAGDGTLLAWRAIDGEGQRSIFFVDLASGVPQRVPSATTDCRCPTPDFGCAPRVSGRRIAWSRDNPTSFLDVCLVDLAVSTTPTLIAQTSADEALQDVSGNDLVWLEGARVVHRNLSTGTNTCIVASSGVCGRVAAAARTSASADAGRVVYNEDNRTIFTTVAAPGVIRTLSDSALFLADAFTLRGDWIVHRATYPTLRTQARVIELSTSASRALVQSAAAQSPANLADRPTTDGRTAAFTDSTDGNLDVVWFRPRGR